MQNACTLEIALSDEFLNFAFRIFQSKCKLVTVFWNLAGLSKRFSIAG